jgi:SAM-dependent methyltransferase
MRNEGAWIPTKYVYKKGRLTASNDRQEVGVGSWLMADRVAVRYDRHLVEFARGRLVDLGCGKVPLCASYRDYVATCTCVDRQKSEVANEFLDVACDLSQMLPFASGSFDTVILSDVLEHIPEPTLLWKEMSRILTPEGSRAHEHAVLLQAPRTAVRLLQVHGVRAPSIRGVIRLRGASPHAGRWFARNIRRPARQAPRLPPPHRAHHGENGPAGRPRFRRDSAGAPRIDQDRRSLPTRLLPCRAEGRALTDLGRYGGPRYFVLRRPDVRGRRETWPRRGPPIGDSPSQGSGSSHGFRRRFVWGTRSWQGVQVVGVPSDLGCLEGGGAPDGYLTDKGGSSCD